MTAFHPPGMPQLSQQDEQLVAYLDGELTLPEREALETQLMASAPLRQRMRELQSGWALLDELPSTTVDDRFTQTTLELVAADLSEKHPKAWCRWGRALLLVSLALALACLGAVIVYGARHARFLRQLADLPIIENLDAYLAIDDLDWLEQISRNDQWNELIEAAELAGAFGPAGLPTYPSPLTDIPPSGVERTVRQLDPAAHSRLHSAWNRFQELPPDRQADVRSRAARVAGSTDPAKLLQTLHAYARFRSHWSSETRGAIERGSHDERQAAFEQALERSRRTWLRQLGEEDSEVLYGVLHVIASDWLNQIQRRAEHFPGYGGDSLRAFWQAPVPSQFEDREAMLLHSVFVRRRGMSSFFRLNADDYDALKAVLSDPLREALDTLMPHPLMQHEVLLSWAIESVQRKSKVARVDSLLALEQIDRLEVELSPPDEMFLSLQRRTQEWQRGGPPAPRSPWPTPNSRRPDR